MDLLSGIAVASYKFLEKKSLFVESQFSVFNQLITDREKAWDGIDGEGALKREGISDRG